MKVYLVTQGDYSDYRVQAVFSTKDEAESYAKIISREYEEAKVETWGMDEKLPLMRGEAVAVTVVMDMEGNSTVTTSNDPVIDECTWYLQTHPEPVRVTRIGRTPEHVAKIANEFRVQILALGLNKHPALYSDEDREQFQKHFADYEEQ